MRVAGRAFTGKLAAFDFPGLADVPVCAVAAAAGRGRQAAAATPNPVKNSLRFIRTRAMSR